MKRPISLIAASLIAFGGISGAQAYDKEQLQAVKSGQKECPGCDLSHAELNDLDLTKVNLAGANLEGALLMRSRLAGANLKDANLTGTRLLTLQKSASRASILRRRGVTGQQDYLWVPAGHVRVPSLHANSTVGSRENDQGRAASRLKLSCRLLARSGHSPTQ